VLLVDYCSVELFIYFLYRVSNTADVHFSKHSISLPLLENVNGFTNVLNYVSLLISELNEIEPVSLVINMGRLRLFGRVEHTDDGDWVKQCMSMETERTGWRGHPR